MSVTNKKSQKFILPTIFVLFGITGDLVQKKILRALYHLYLKNHLPQKFLIYGFARRAFTDEKIRTYLKNILIKQGLDMQNSDKFLAAFHYVQGDFADLSAYTKLASILVRADGSWRVCSNKLFYLSVPPAAYKQIVNNLHASGLTIPRSPQEGWTRVILEKPFGTDLATAKQLDIQLGSLFKEEQIYRVDHYLAKETVRNILAFRFSNVFLEPAWNNKFIEKIEIKLLEKTGVSERGDFYDKVGALRDVGQNHLLQLLALFIMDEPMRFTPEATKKERADALSSLKIMSSDEVKKYTVRGQYLGYRSEKGVDPKSNTETHFKMKISSDKHDFRGVPLYIESGKCMEHDLIEVVITFKPSTSPFINVKRAPQNVLHYQLRPEEKIKMCFLAKKPGFEYIVKEHELGFDYHQAYDHKDFVDDCEALLFDIIKGDQTLFVSTQEIITQWEFIEPIIDTWKQGVPKLNNYKSFSYDGATIG